MIRVAHYILAAAEAGYMTPPAWQAWADRRIGAIAQIEPRYCWLVDVSLAQNIDELHRALGDRVLAESKQKLRGWCREQHGFVLLRKDLDLRSRLLMLASISEDPENLNYWVHQADSAPEPRDAYKAVLKRELAFEVRRAARCARLIDMWAIERDSRLRY